MKRVAVAVLRRTRGIRGEIAATPLSDHPDRYGLLKTVYVGERTLTVQRTWWHGGDIVFQFEGIDSIEAAKPLTGLDVEIPESERVPLPPGEYYPDQLTGFEVFDGTNVVGVITGWEDIGFQTLMRAGEMEFPYRMIRHVDLDAKRLEVELPEGLEDLNRP